MLALQLMIMIIRMLELIVMQMEKEIVTLFEDLMFHCDNGMSQGS